MGGGDQVDNESSTGWVKGIFSRISGAISSAVGQGRDESPLPKPMKPGLVSRSPPQSSFGHQDGPDPSLRTFPPTPTSLMPSSDPQQQIPPPPWVGSPQYPSPTYLGDGQYGVHDVGYYNNPLPPSSSYEGPNFQSVGYIPIPRLNQSSSNGYARADSYNAGPYLRTRSPFPPESEVLLEHLSEIITYGCGGMATVKDLTNFIKKDYNLNAIAGPNYYAFFLNFVQICPEFEFENGVIQRTSCVNVTDIAQRMAELPITGDVTSVVKKVRQAAIEIFGEAVSVFPFGSSVNGFGDTNSDIDLVMRLERDLDANPVSILGSSDTVAAFERVGFVVHESRLNAKIPILRLKLGSVDIDLSCNNTLPTFNTILLYRYSKICPAIANLARQVREWARSMGIHGALEGHLSSYSFNLMTIFFFQVKGALGSLQTNCGFDSFQSESPTRHNISMTWCPVNRDIADSLTLNDFLVFYKEEFPWGKSVVSVRLGKMVPIEMFPRLKSKNLFLIDIEDPFDLERNLNCHIRQNSMYLFQQVFDAIANQAQVPRPLPLTHVARGAFQRGDIVCVTDLHHSTENLTHKVLGSGYFGVRLRTAGGTLFCVEPDQIYKDMNIDLAATINLDMRRPSQDRTSPDRLKHFGYDRRLPTPHQKSNASSSTAPQEESSEGAFSSDWLKKTEEQEGDAQDAVVWYLRKYHPDIAQDELGKLGLSEVETKEPPTPPRRPTPENARGPTVNSTDPYGTTFSWYMDNGYNNEEAQTATALYLRQQEYHPAMFDDRHNQTNRWARGWVKKGLSWETAEARALVDIERQEEQAARVKKPHEQEGPQRRQTYITEEVRLKQAEIQTHQEWFQEEGFDETDSYWRALDWWAWKGGGIIDRDESLGNPDGRKAKKGLRVFVHDLKDQTQVQNNSEGIVIDYYTPDCTIEVGFGHRIKNDGYPIERHTLSLENVIRAYYQ